MGFASLVVQVEEKHGVIMDEKGFKDSNFSACYSSDEVSSIGSVDSDDDDDSNDNNASSEVNSSLSSSPNSPFSYSNNSGHRLAAVGDSLNNMSSLLQQLPIKRGLSKHFEGKSQSFTSLSNVTCLEDLAKPENPYNKKLKCCKSYVGLYGGCQRSSSNHRNMNNIPRSSSSRLISKKTSRGSCSSSLFNTTKRNISSRPPSYS